MSGYALKFLDGPAQKEEIHTVIEPQKVRWYCSRNHPLNETVFSWWTFEEPLHDPDLTVTVYRLIGAAPRADGSMLVTYGMDDDAIPA